MSKLAAPLHFDLFANLHRDAAAGQAMRPRSLAANKLVWERTRFAVSTQPAAHGVGGPGLGALAKAWRVKYFLGRDACCEGTVLPTPIDGTGEAANALVHWPGIANRFLLARLFPACVARRSFVPDKLPPRALAGKRRSAS
jgi:hypothetical protein